MNNKFRNTLGSISGIGEFALIIFPMIKIGLNQWPKWDIRWLKLVNLSIILIKRLMIYFSEAVPMKAIPKFCSPLSWVFFAPFCADGKLTPDNKPKLRPKDIKIEKSYYDNIRPVVWITLYTITILCQILKQMYRYLDAGKLFYLLYITNYTKYMKYLYMRACIMYPLYDYNGVIDIWFGKTKLTLI